MLYGWSGSLRQTFLWRWSLTLGGLPCDSSREPGRLAKARALRSAEPNAARTPTQSACRKSTSSSSPSSTTSFPKAHTRNIQGVAPRLFFSLPASPLCFPCLLFRACERLCTRLLSCDFDHLSLLAHTSSGFSACWFARPPTFSGAHSFSRTLQIAVIAYRRVQAKLSIYKLVSLCVQLRLAKNFTAVLIVLTALSLAFHVTFGYFSDLSNSLSLLQV